jgi:L-lysine exporter family protein LysE/ArgO
MPVLPPYLQGLGLGAGLIIAIGAQNAHVLRLGLRRQQVALTVAVCILCDVLLIAAGIAGMGAVIGRNPALLALVRWGGAAFLAGYGVRAWRAAWRSGTLAVEEGAAGLDRRQALSMALALSLLNPHVYLDTVVLLGSIGGQQAAGGRLWFALGAMSASVAWFLSLGFGARVLSPIFSRPMAWRALDAMIGAVMLVLAGTLAFASPTAIHKPSSPKRVPRSIEAAQPTL